MRQINIGTRTSQLARWQTDHVAHALRSHWSHLEISVVPVVTKGDRSLDQALPDIGGKGLFTSELETHLRSGRIDLAVHSLKDLPVEDSPGLVLGAILARQHVADVVVAQAGLTLETLPAGAVIGTSSLRRQAQLLSHRSDLSVRSIRGNIDTRIQKTLRGDYEAAVLALAGVERLALMEHVSQEIPFTVMLPAPGQGALAVQCRADDEETLALLAAIDDAEARHTTLAERTFLYALGGGCSAPIAAMAVARQEPTDKRAYLAMHVRVLTPTGSQMVEAQGEADDPIELAHSLADTARGMGADEILHLVHDEVGVKQNKASTVARLPLRGKRIVVTRAKEQAGALADELSARGATPILLPAIELQALATRDDYAPVLHQLDRYDWIIFTSANAVRFFRTAWHDVYDSSTPLPGIPIAVVGTATAQAVVEVGWQVVKMPEKFVGQAIASSLGDIRGAQILLPRSAQGRPETVEALQAAGAEVHELPLYQPVTGNLPAAELQQAIQGGIDAITFTSPSTVQNFVAAVRAAGLANQLFDDVSIACIGPTTAQAAEAVGLSPNLIASPHTISGLVTALETALQDRKIH